MRCFYESVDVKIADLQFNKNFYNLNSNIFNNVRQWPLEYVRMLGSRVNKEIKKKLYCFQFDFLDFLQACTASGPPAPVRDVKLDGAQSGITHLTVTWSPPQPQCPDTW